MTGRLTNEFKHQCADFILYTSKQLILTNFDKNDKKDKTFVIDNESNHIEITRHCFAGETYFEDYSISFKTTIQNKTIYSRFYLEWKNNDITTHLIPANTIWDTVTGNCYNRKINIIRA
jgi:hypothetical protein